MAGVFFALTRAGDEPEDDGADEKKEDDEEPEREDYSMSLWRFETRELSFIAKMSRARSLSESFSPRNLKLPLLNGISSRLISLTELQSNRVRFGKKG